MSNTDTFEIQRLTQENVSLFKSLINLFNTVFEEDESNIGSDKTLSDLLSNHHFIVMVALQAEEVVGGLTAYELPMYYAEHSEIFLYDLAVKSEYQRKGIGKCLLQSLKEYCVQHEIKEFFVMAHEEDIHAVEVYRATGGKSEKVINFLYEADAA